MVICLERGADLHMAQLMPLPLTVSCFSKIQIGFTSLVLAYPGSPGKRAVKWVCARACVYPHIVSHRISVIIIIIIMQSLTRHVSVGHKEDESQEFMCREQAFYGSPGTRQWPATGRAIYGRCRD